MRWTPGGVSSNIEDRRGGGGRFGGFGGGRGLGIGGFLVLLILSVVFRQDFFSLLGGGGTTATQEAPAPPATESAEEHKEVQFVSFVLDSVQSYWARTLPSQGARYTPARLVLFRDATQSACGAAQTATGPFYCPGDQKVYLDLGFFEELDRRFGAPGDFAQAYVIAHEVGHHVQTLLGIESKVRELQQSNPGATNQIQVRMELQADCLAGVWGHATAEMGILQEGDAQEGIDAAAAVGDDRLQKQGQGYVNPDAFTHGSSAQRTDWFLRGFRSGQVEQCNTFGR
jgi:predicted metalloprotease